MVCPRLFLATLVIGFAITPEISFAQSSEPNIAWAAKPSSSFTSSDTSTAALNSGFDPQNSADARHGSYGNWPRRGTEWVQFDWSQPVTTGRIEVYWWADGRGVHLPVASRLSYWDGTNFLPVAHVSGLGVAGNQYNVTTFDEVKTTRLRLEMDGEGQNATGLLQWRVIDSGSSPKFPPIVVAGVDRDVVLGGRTYLGGTVKASKRRHGRRRDHRGLEQGIGTRGRHV